MIKHTGKEESGGMLRGGRPFLLVVACLYVPAFLVDTELTLNALTVAARLL